MKLPVARIWENGLPGDTEKRLRRILETNGREKKTEVFFRADDIGRPGPQWRRMMELFSAHDAPLCLAVVPQWLERDGVRAMAEFEPDHPRWCWHQHGFSHVNHELQGKKCEFGDSRTRAEISTDLDQGRERLTSLLGDLFHPVFTPPWNRCSSLTIELLREKGYAALSRWTGAKPLASGIPDLAVNVDLHTRKETDLQQGWDALYAEMKKALASGRMGIMLHHQRMNGQAFAFLDLLLTVLREQPGIEWRTFRTLGPV
ncbi:MAG: polysaccharide deacetylase family protein [Desulfobulbaceae bacterium]